MAVSTEAPAGTMAEGPTSHTPNQVSRLTAPQLRLLHRGLDPKRVGKDDKGHAHMEAWDIKRYLLRVFGFAGYDTENRELSMVKEIEIPGQGQNAKSRWTVIYRAQVRLIVKDVQGREIGHWDGEAVGDSYNQPKIGDAHDMAMKTAASQALKRAATNLGDQFGLSLYNGASTDPVVGFCMAHPPAEWEKAAETVPQPEDPPVRPEPAGSRDAGEEESVPAAGDGQQYAEDVHRQQQAGDPKLEILDKLYLQAIEGRFNRLVLIQVRGNADKDGVLEYEVDGPPPERRRMPFREFLGVLEAVAQQQKGAA
ncbi:Rad52/Rad22 family DNA repair protein [Streptomyces sp. NPDC001617]